MRIGVVDGLKTGAEVYNFKEKSMGSADLRIHFLDTC